MKILKIYIGVNIILYFLFSCPIDMKVISQNHICASAIGKKIKTKENIWALSISDVKPNKSIKYVTLSGVGVSGPEVIDSQVLAANTIFYVKNVLVSYSIFDRVIYIVEEVNSKHFEGIEIQLEVKNKCNDGNIGLDQNIYKLIS